MAPPRKPGRKKDPNSKRSQGADRHSMPRESFHAPPELFAAMHDYCDAQEVRPDKSEVLRVALREFLAKRGYWPPKPRPDA